MVINLNKYSTRIAIIHNIPKFFFRNIEAATSFGVHLFPPWANKVFASTHLHRKFESVYIKYKAIKTKRNRDKIIDAFISINQIETLCNNGTVTPYVLNDLPKSIHNELDILFEYLYKTSINYLEFQLYVNDTVKDSIDRFIGVNGLNVCPLCGLEGFLNLDGQARIALDHWLCRDLFPMTAVNFKNLFPIGPSCNGRPAKGETNVLIDNETDRNRVIAYYPYLTHNGITTSFKFVKEPTIGGISDADWVFTCVPTNPAEQNIFDSWNSTLNISIRYLDYHRKNIFPMWEEDYKRFIEEDHEIKHADDIDKLRDNFKIWRASFPLKGRSGAILYRTFIDYLIKNASDAYLTGLCENFKRDK